MITFTLYVFATIGLTSILVDSKILEGRRNWIKDQSQMLGYMVGCYMCMGFWSGLLVGGLLFNPDFGTLFCLACAGSWLSMTSAIILNKLENVQEHETR